MCGTHIVRAVKGGRAAVGPPSRSVMSRPRERSYGKVPLADEIGDSPRNCSVGPCQAPPARAARDGRPAWPQLWVAFDS